MNRSTASQRAANWSEGTEDHQQSRAREQSRVHEQAEDGRRAGEQAGDDEVHSLDEVLNRIDAASDEHDQVSLGNALDAMGHHSFAPLLLLAGLIMLAPGPADIPGVPVILGLFVIVVAVQPLIGRKHIWVPQWLERRDVSCERVKKMISWLRRPAGWIDRLLKKRYTWLVNHAGVTVIAIASILIAASTPVLEFVPFSANLAGGAITAFALALIARDGLVAGIAILLSIGTVGLVAWQLIGG